MMTSLVASFFLNQLWWIIIRTVFLEMKTTVMDGTNCLIKYTFSVK